MMINWEVKKLGDVCEIFADGDWIESKDQSLDGIRLIQTGNVGNGFFKDRGEKARYISEATFKSLRCTEIFEGDCLISRLPDPVGRACILPDTGEKMITAVDCTIVRFNPKEVISTYFNYYSQSVQYLNDIERETTGTTRKRISRSKLGDIKIPLPPLPEQQRLVTILDEVFAALATAKENAAKNLQNARELFESVLQGVFANRGVGWEERKLGEVLKLEYGKPLPDEKRNPNGKYPVYGANGEINRSNEFYYDKPSIIVGRKGSAGEINLTEPKFWPLDVSYFVTFDYQKDDLNFIYYLLSNLELPRLAKGVKPGINRNEVYAIEVRVPPLPEQRAIVAKLDALSAETKKLEALYQQKLANLEELKQSVLRKAFRGEI